jgi:hypothetical protein
MAGNTSDDVYDDPDNILADTDDTVNGATELPEGQADNLSQSIFKPELGDDDRGSIPDLEAADEGAAHDEMSTTHPEDSDSDSFHLGDVDPADEQDGAESE